MEKMNGDNKYFIFLEKLRKSGKINMLNATPYLMEKFGVDRKEAKQIILDWMKSNI